MSLYLSNERAMQEHRQARDRARPNHTSALDLDIHSYPEASKPVRDRRYVVALFEWQGGSWRRVRKLTGPMKFDAALDELATQITRRRIPHLRDA